MILHYRGNTGLSRAELLHQGRARGAYSEPGWIHRGLGDLITDHGVPAEARAVSDLTELADALSDGPVIASVSFRFPTIGSKGGHLVLVTGPTWTDGDISGFFFNDPSRWGANNSYVTATRFDASFTGRIIATTT